MNKVRKVASVFKSRPTLEGAGVHLKRAFGFHEKPLLDPFLLLDDFHGDDPALYLPGFPWHPHRGIETITYMRQGTVEHGDSMGNKGVIYPGDVQWMTAGSGIIHQEMPKGEKDGSMWGFQLWANLPRSHKLMDPRYREVKAQDILQVETPPGATVKIIAGRVNGDQGPVRDIVIDPEYFEVIIPQGAEFRHAIAGDHTAFAYVIEGSGYFDDDPRDLDFGYASGRYFDLPGEKLFGQEHLIVFGPGEEVHVTAAESPLSFLFVSGKPLREPVAWWGPIVMNTRQELETAFAEYQNGTFIK